MRGYAFGLTALICVAGCSSVPATPSAAIPSGIEILIKASDARLTLDVAGAERIERETRCGAEFVRMETSTVALFRLRATADQPNPQQCLRMVQSLPGVAFAEPNITAKTLQ